MWDCATWVPVQVLKNLDMGKKSTVLDKERDFNVYMKDSSLPTFWFAQRVAAKRVQKTWEKGSMFNWDLQSQISNDLNSRLEYFIR